MVDKSQTGREKFLNRPVVLLWDILPGKWVIGSRQRSGLSFNGPDLLEAFRHFRNRFCFKISTFEDEAARLLQNERNGLPIDAASYFRGTNTELRSFRKP